MNDLPQSHMCVQTVTFCFLTLLQYCGVRYNLLTVVFWMKIPRVLSIEGKGVYLHNVFKSRGKYLVEISVKCLGFQVCMCSIYKLNI